jgi:hypothetical protein
VQLTTPPHAYYMVYEQHVRERPEVDAFVEWMLTTFRNL